MAEAQVDGADQRTLVLHQVPAAVAPQAHGNQQPLGEGCAEEQVDAGVGTAVQAGQQHQEGEGRCWRDKRGAARSRPLVARNPEQDSCYQTDRQTDTR